METLSTELKSVIARRIERAQPDEIMAITGALAALEIATPTAAPRPAADIKARFELVGNGEIVRDHTTGLEWARKPLADRHEWKDAAAACSALKLCGHTDWRLPTVRELQSIVDFERHDPAIDTDYFECPVSWFWASTPLKSSPGDCAWGVNFHSGYAGWGYHYGSGFVRAVRVGQF